MSKVLYSIEQERTIETKALRHKEEAGVLLLCFIVLLQSAALVATVAVEFTMMKECISFIFAGTPGEQAVWSTTTLAMSGTLALIGYDIYAKRHSNGFSVRFIERCVEVAIPAFSIAVFLLVASSFYFNGLDSIFNASTSKDLFADNSSASNSGGMSSVIGSLFSFFGFIASIGMGSVAIITLFVSRSLMDLIADNLSKIRSSRFAAKEARNSIATLNDCHQKFEKAAREYAKLLSIDEQMLRLKVVHQIISIRSEAISPYETWLTNQNLRGEGATARFKTNELDLDGLELAKRLKEEKAITVKHVLAAITDVK